MSQMTRTLGCCLLFVPQFLIAQSGSSLGLSATNLAFPYTVTGTRSAAQTVQLQNSAAASVTVSKIALSGANATDFSLGTDCPLTLAAGASCTISVVGTPTVAGERVAMVTVTTSLAAAPQTVGLWLAAVPANMGYAPNIDLPLLDGPGAGSAVYKDASGHGNDATPGTTPPVLLPGVGQAFSPNQGIALPASIDANRTFCFALYLNPISSGPQPVNNLPALLSSSGGFAGLSLWYGIYPQGSSAVAANAYATTIVANGLHPTVTQNVQSGYHVKCTTLGSASDGTVDHDYVDGVESGAYLGQGQSAGLQTSGNWILGANQAFYPNYGFYGTMYRFVSWPQMLSSSQIAAGTAALNVEIQNRGVAVTAVPQVQAQRQLLVAGDSITFGYNSAGPQLTPWPTSLAYTAPDAWVVNNLGISGITAQAILGSEPNRIAPRCKSGGTSSVAILFAGTNDMKNVAPESPATTAGYLAGWVKVVKAAGCQAFVATTLSRHGLNAEGTATFDSEKNALDTLIRANFSTWGADGIIDFAADPGLGADGAYANAAYFQADQTHPNQAGQNRLGAIAINSLLYTYGYTAAAPHVLTAGTALGNGDRFVTLATTAPGAFTLPDCTGPTGGTYVLTNPQAKYAETIQGGANQPINGQTGAVTVPANSALTLTVTLPSSSSSGCQWTAVGH